MVCDGDGFAFGGGNFVTAPFEVDGVVIVDPARAPQGEMKIEESRGGTRALGAAVLEDGLLPNLVRNQPGAAIFCFVLALDFHLKNLISVLPGLDFGVGQEGDKAFLESAEAAFDFAFCLRGWGDEMGDFEISQCALELTSGIAVIAAGTGPEKTEGVGVNRAGNAVEFKGAAEVGEMIPSGVGADEGARQIETGMVVHGEQENLFVRSGPPLMNGTVVLPEVADFGAPKTPVDPGFAEWGWDKVGKVGFDVSLDAGAGACEVAEALQLIADELVVWGALQRQEALEEGVGLRGPGSVMVAAAETGLEGFLVSQPGAPKLVKAGFANPEQAGGTGGVLQAGIKIREDAEDEIGREAVNDLFLFKTGISVKGREPDMRKKGSVKPGGMLPSAPWGLGVSLRSAPADTEAPGSRWQWNQGLN